MTKSERKKIEKALKYVERNEAIAHKRFTQHKWGLMTTIINPDYYNKAAKKLGSTMYDPIVEYFYESGDKEKGTLLVLLHRLYRFYKIDRVPLFFLDVMLDDAIEMKIKKQAAMMLTGCFTNIPLDKIKQVYGIKEFQFNIMVCLPFCEDEGRHLFAVDVLKEQSSPQIIESAVHSLTTEKITSDEAELLKAVYSASKDPYLRYAIMELLHKSHVDNLKEFFVASYKKERLLPNRLQAIIGLYVKSDADTADKTIHELVGGIIKRKSIDERTMGDLRGMVDWLNDLKELYPSEGFRYAYEMLSSMDMLCEKR